MTLDATALKALCDIFGRYAVAEVEPGQRGLVVRVLGANNVSELSDDPKYSQPYGFVREAKVLLEEIETWPPGEQVPACLRQMENARRGRRPPSLLLVLERLIDRWFIDGNRWNAEQQHAYREVAPMILQWKDYFLSYTNRGTPPINNDYRELIEYHYGEKFKDRMATENGVARVVARYIRRHGLLGFFDEENIKCGEIIQDRVKEFCLKTFALVQLVEHQMFVDPGEDKINWCPSARMRKVVLPSGSPRTSGSRPSCSITRLTTTSTSCSSARLRLSAWVRPFFRLPRALEFAWR